MGLQYLWATRRVLPIQGPARRSTRSIRARMVTPCLPRGRVRCEREFTRSHSRGSKASLTEQAQSLLAGDARLGNGCPARQLQMSATPEPRAQLASSLLLVLATAFAAFIVLIEFARYTAGFFCSILAAVALSSVADRLRFRGRLPHAVALALTLALALVISGGLGWWVGPQLVPQFEELIIQVPRGMNEARRWYETSWLGQRLGAELPSLAENAPSLATMVQSTGQFMGAGFAVLADFLILVVVATFLAANPQRYAAGLVRLLPSRHRSRGKEVIAAMGSALRRWLLARAALMLLVTVLLGIGLLLLGVPLALPLAILAGLFSFVPYVGPTLAVIPPLAVGLLKSPMHALSVAALYLGVQLLESYVVEPMVEARAVSLPPALIIGAQVISAVWLGAIGILIATPLLVVAVVAVQILYQREVLGDDVDVIGS